MIMIGEDRSNETKGLNLRSTAVDLEIHEKWREMLTGFPDY